LNKKIAVLLIIVLSMASMYAALVPKAKADSSDIKILSYTWYVSPADSYTSWRGDFVVVGEIQNIGSQTIDLPYVQAVAYTTDGQLAASAYTTAFVKDILPQQKAPFYIDFTTDSSSGGNFSGTLNWIPLFDHVDVSVGYAQDTNDTMYRGLNVAAKTSFTTGDTFTVTGIIQNNGTETTGQVWAVTTFYNATGTAIAANYTNYVTSSLAPAATIPFTATPMDNTATLSSQINSYSVIIQTKEPDASASASTSSTPENSQSPNTSPTATPVSSTQPTQSPQNQESSSSSDLLYIVAGAVIAVIVIVAVVFFLRKKR
jgi:hypothetical protein